MKRVLILLPYFCSSQLSVCAHRQIDARRTCGVEVIKNYPFE